MPPGLATDCAGLGGTPESLDLRAFFDLSPLPPPPEPQGAQDEPDEPDDAELQAVLTFYGAALRSYRAQPSYNAFKGAWRKRSASSQLGYWLPVRASERSAPVSTFVAGWLQTSFGAGGERLFIACEHRQQYSTGWLNRMRLTCVRPYPATSSLSSDNMRWHALECQCLGRILEPSPGSRDRTG
eukprot:COSAG01_NODE_339_length_18653_cov_21.648378_10_plen_184_part_00